MKQVTIITFLLLICTLSFSQHSSEHRSGKMELLSSCFLFPEVEKPHSSLSLATPQGSFINNTDPEEGFTLKFLVDFKDFDKDRVILEIPDVLTVRFRNADPAIRDQQNYPAHLMEDGSLPVMESIITLNTSSEKPFRKSLTIGFPLAMVPNLNGEHEVILSFTKAQFVMYLNGEIVDSEFPIGFPDLLGEKTWRIDDKCVNSAMIFFPSINPERDLTKRSNLQPDIQYWTPRWHNAWVGDVATFYHTGRYHVFYLFDRRHHSSKFGVGGHYFEHFSTTDFVTWTEHEAATPIEEQWETFGTGTPFILNDQLCISYGLHTSRVYPIEKTMYPCLFNYFNKNNKTGFFHADVNSMFPSGSTYSISQDGVSKFQKTGNIFHFCENPSVYNNNDGTFMMFANYHANGTWKSDNIDGDWYCVDKDFPLGGDCTFYFKWGRFEYVIGGFVNLWRRAVNSNETAWEDIVGEGKDFYNGINVPAITAISDGRFLMAGWFPIRGWGGPFVIHELIQYDDGRIGTKWMKELTPETEKPQILGSRIKEESVFSLHEQNFMLSFEVYPKNKKQGKAALSFLSDQEGDGCEFQICMDDSTAQFSNASREGFAIKERSLREGGSPQGVGNYAIENLIGTDKPFTVRMIVKNNPKLGGSIIDTEIAGQRTLITYRADLNIQNLSIKLEDIEIRNLQLSAIKE